MIPSSASQRRRLERLTPEQRAQVNVLRETVEEQARPGAPSPRQPRGLLGTMHTHDDFNTPLAEEFLIP